MIVEPDHRANSRYRKAAWPDPELVHKYIVMPFPTSFLFTTENIICDMAKHVASSSRLQKRTIQQLPIPERTGHDAIIDSTYLDDIESALERWKCQRVFLVHSRALDEATDVIKDLKERLGPLIVGTKSGVGAHSPYPDVLDIASSLVEHDIHCLISIGSSSYSDASKIARLMQANLGPEHLTIDTMEALVNQEKGNAENLKDPTCCLILVPTSLSASEWNNTSSATNPQTQKKQHFTSSGAAPDLILLDPEVASTSPRKLWLSSGMRAIDHCVETMVNERCTKEVFSHMQGALETLLKGLREYKDGEASHDRDGILDGISTCQLGSRDAMMGLLIWKTPMGLSHTIGHQLGSVCGVMHGVTTCIMLAPVLRYFYGKRKVAQDNVLKVWNEALGWEEENLADAVNKFVKILELPSTLKEVGVEKEEDLDRIAGHTLTDILGAGEGIGKEDVKNILNMARG
ncbi:iron-containing alcohol dehydrogenase-domain containing protein [Phaeosphaeria sp. MPI-PUGE-AT-0046c]|nr:iron-containing alcohol dehydrogenase-domain containing protein [Phaeosphaeria sp. MPI-PUGE-AT-0046c]